MPSFPVNKSYEKVRKAIRRHVNAQIALSWKGAAHPDEWDAIEQEAKGAKKALFELLPKVVR